MLRKVSIFFIKSEDFLKLSHKTGQYSLIFASENNKH